MVNTDHSVVRVQVTADDMTVFHDIVGPNILTGPDDVEPYNVDWMRNLRYVCVCVCMCIPLESKEF